MSKGCCGSVAVSMSPNCLCLFATGAMQVGWCGSSVACATARGCCGSVAVSVSPGCLGSFATAGFNFSARTALDIQLPKSSFDCILKPLSQFAVTWHLSPAARHKRGVSVRPNPRKRGDTNSAAMPCPFGMIMLVPLAPGIYRKVMTLPVAVRLPVIALLCVAIAALLWYFFFQQAEPSLSDDKYRDQTNVPLRSL